MGKSTKQTQPHEVETSFFTAEDLQKASRKIEVGEIEVDEVKFGIRFITTSLADLKLIQSADSNGGAEGQLSPDQLEKTIAVLQKTVVDEHGEPMFTEETLDTLKMPVINAMLEVVSGQQGKE